MNAPSFFRSFSGPDYNIIGFDPRGVAFSEPNLDCFHGNKALAVNWAQSMSNLIPVASTEELNAMYELTGAYGDLCGQKLNATASYVGTPVVARDMLTIAEKLAVASGGKKEDAVLNLLAASYGSALGATFATLFPDRVGRFVLDAIVDGEDYYDNERITAMLDVDEAAKAFFTLCNKAGSERCAFYEDSAEKIEERYQKLLAAIKEHPIAVWDDKITQIPSLATSKQLKQVFYQTLRASSQFPTFAQILLDLEKRNGTSLLRSAGTPCYDCEDTKLAIQTVIPMVPPGGMIACVDTDGRGNLSTLGAWKEHVDAEVKASAYAGDVWAHYTLDCRKWPFRSPPSQRFNGKYLTARSLMLIVLADYL
jgi:pimeloyl-ACP methyl ester carboxylesterase